MSTNTQLHAQLPRAWSSPEPSSRVAPWLSAMLREGAVISCSVNRAVVAWGAPMVAARPTPGLCNVYSPGFFLDEARPWRTYTQFAEMSYGALQDALEAVEPQQAAVEWDCVDRASFERTFADLHARIVSGELQKGVPYVAEDGAADFGDARVRASLIIHALRYAGQSPVHLYGCWSKHEGLLGATPEVLFERHGQAITTMALAGTVAPSVTQAQALSDIKLAQEHAIVVDAIVEALGAFGEVGHGETTLMALPRLSHLRTSIHVTTPAQVDDSALVAALHPTPALGAFPRAAGAAWLEMQKRLGDRQRFGAPFGVSVGKRALYLVAIRNIEWRGSRVSLRAGAGVVRDSTVDGEWNEIALKRGAVKAMLGL